MAESRTQFAVGDHVRKTAGDYTFEGIVVASFQKLTGAQRYVVENVDGLLLILNESQLRKVDARAG